MRVLFTNNTLDARAGSELYVRDVAARLRELGHAPVCFSLELGEIARELEAQGIEVTDDLASLRVAPEVIHAQHAIEATLAALTFPDRPVISFCHGPRAWQEAPCRMPNVVRYVAVDEACRTRLIEREGIAPERIELMLNFVDTRRFQPRDPLPKRPRRALVFSNTMTEETGINAAREACSARGIELDIAGAAAGRACENPEHLLPRYDVVFAKARGAIEAMAVGCAVIQLDHFGAGRLITTANFDALRPLNFGYASMKEPISAAHLGAELDRYDAADGGAVSRLIRTHASLDGTLGKLVALYEEAMRTPIAPFNPAQVASDFLRFNFALTKRFVTTFRWPKEQPFSFPRAPLAPRSVQQAVTDALAGNRVEELESRLAADRAEMRERWLATREELARAKEKIRELNDTARRRQSWWRLLWQETER